MNNYMGEARNRSQTLLIVEGNHEKNELFWLIFKCFPEINIDMDNVWIYGTNIYLLCEDIVKEKKGVGSRCIPFEQENISDTCVCCGKPANTMVYWGKAY